MDLSKQWTSLGFLFSVKKCEDAIDLEALIAETTWGARDNPRLLNAMATWLIHFGDLVNVARLQRLILTADSPVLGGVLRFVLNNGADSKLSVLLKNCARHKRPEFLFHVMAKNKATAQHEKGNAMPEFLKHGLYCSSVTINKSALRPRQYLLKHHPKLALRAVFGATLKADILYYLMQGTAKSIRALSKQLGFSYQPVYHECMRLKKNALISCVQLDKSASLSLTKQSRRFLKAIPV